MDFQDKKHTHIFNWYDRNGDGYVTPDDMEKMLEIWKTFAGEDRENGAAIAKGFEHLWQLILEGREAKSTERISKEEFIRIIRSSVMAPEHFQVTIISITKGLLGALDRDGSGTLSMEEYEDMYGRLGIPPTYAPEAFKKLDRDNSGEISLDEITAGVSELFLSADPNAPGNWLLGPMDA